jgi:hypothetical protein
MAKRLLDNALPMIKEDGINTNKAVTAQLSSVATAGGNPIPFLGAGNTLTTGLGLYWGSGAPTISAPQGSLYLNTTGSGIANRLFVNTNGTTGWTNFASAT